MDDYNKLKKISAMAIARINVPPGTLTIAEIVIVRVHVIMTKKVRGNANSA